MTCRSTRFEQLSNTSIKIVVTCLKNVPLMVPADEIDPSLFRALALYTGDLWILGKPDEIKEAYGRGQYHLMIEAFPWWMQLLCEHKIEYGSDHESAVEFVNKYGDIIPFDGEKLCRRWDMIVEGRGFDEIIKVVANTEFAENQIDDSDLLERLKKMEES